MLRVRWMPAVAQSPRGVSEMAAISGYDTKVT